MFLTAIPITARVAAPLLALLCTLTIANRALAKSLNGFELDQGLLPVAEIFQGGPPKDGIPAIDEPLFLAAEQMQVLEPDDMVLGITDGVQSKAYPIGILNWHEIVNDELGGVPVVVTFCPLCGSGMVFERTINGQALDFGVSGLLYNSDVLLYDRQTDSLWSQIEQQAVTGFWQGQQLQPIAVQHTSWQRWQKNHPQTLVLSFDTGFRRRYNYDPYGGYEDTAATFFPVKFRAQGFHPKQRVLGLEHNGISRAWPLVELAKAGQPITDNIAGLPVFVHYDAASQTAWVEDGQGQTITSVTLFWFAWAAFHEDTSVYHYQDQ
ncbi:MAG: DUF3179 domain-containing protein [Oceanospirillaceae bacterium]|jgi:hypothetical protein|nr:DUF3179 domain-containing protein [Oceanospirillaceae bacterium]